jgi:protein DGCR14
MKVPQSKELVIRDEDKIIEYKEKQKDLLKTEKSEQVQFKQPGRSTQMNKLAIYQNVLSRDEFRRVETKELVLDDDYYLNFLEEIIQKDYFPDLYETKKEKVKFNFLNQLIHNDLERAQSVTGNRVENTNVRDNLDKINKDYFEDKKIDIKEDIKKIPEVDVNKLSVDSFCMKYSSDELESLRDIFFKDNQKRLKKYLWMYEQEHKANEKMKTIKEYSEDYLALPDPCKHYQQPNLITAESDAKNSLFFQPDYSNTNNRMVLMKEIEASKEMNNQTNTQDNMEKFSKNISNEKAVSKENTRLPKNFIETLINKHSHKLRKKIYESYENSDVIKLLKELKEIDAKAKEEKISSETPIINGYKLLKYPEPIPGEIDKIPIFTWGELASTPNVLDIKTEPKFIVPQTPDRETLAHSLANKSLSSKRQRDDMLNKT